MPLLNFTVGADGLMKCKGALIDTEVGPTGPIIPNSPTITTKYYQPLYFEYTGAVPSALELYLLWVPSPKSVSVSQVFENPTEVYEALPTFASLSEQNKL